MNPHLLRTVVGVVLATVAGGFVVLLIEGINSLAYPPPAGSDLSKPEELKAYIAGLPLAAFLVVLLAWTAGAFTAGGVVTALVKNNRRAHAIGLGGLFTLFVLINVLTIPGPLWLTVCGLIVNIPAALSGAEFVQQFLPEKPAASAVTVHVVE